MGEGWIPPGFHKKCHNLDRFLSSDLKRIAKFKSFKFNHPASCSPPRGSRPYSRHSSASLEITKMISTQLFFHWCSYTILIHFSSSLLLSFTHHYTRRFSTLLPVFTRHFRNQKMSITQPFLHGYSIAVFLYHDHPGSVAMKTYTILIQPAAHSFYSCFFPALPATGKWREGGWEAGIKDLKFTGPCLWTLVTNSKKNQLD